MLNSINTENSSIMQDVLHELLNGNEPQYSAVISSNYQDSRNALNLLCFEVINENVVYDGEDNCPLIAFFGTADSLADIKNRLVNLYSVDADKLSNLHDYSIYDPDINNPEVAVIDALVSKKYDYIFFDVGINLFENENGAYESLFFYDLNHLRQNSNAHIVFTAVVEQGSKSNSLEDNSILPVFLN